MFERSFLGGSNRGGPIESKGFRKFLEILLDNLSRFFFSNFICLLCLLPGAAGVLWAMEKDNPALALAIGCVGGALFGPAYGAMSDGMLYAMRGVPGNWWKKYRRAWKRDWKDELLPGAILGALTALLAYEAAVVFFSEVGLPVSVYVCTGVAVAVAAAIFTFFWPQRVFSDLTNRQVFRNSRLMSMAHPTLALKAALVHLVYWGLMFVLMPYSGLFLLLLGFWFPELLGLWVVYPQLNQDFKIEERLEENGLV